MACSYVKTPPMATSKGMRRSKYYISQSSSNWSQMGALINLCIHIHSCIWSKIWEEIVWWSVLNSSVTVSYRIGNWKLVKNTIANVLNSQKECWGSLIYNFKTTMVMVIWNNHRRIEPSIREFDENHRWKVITSFLGSSPGLPSNLRMYNGNLTRMLGHEGSWCIISFINCWLGWGY